MSIEPRETENLFSYGTLQKAEVQLATFGRTLEGEADTLIGYVLMLIQIQDEDFARKNGAQQRNLHFTGINSDTVEGTVLRVTKNELELADSYEPAEYQRILVKLSSGLDAWVYLSNE
jgi:gamma-glutamylcyclotransferase (GGCT)/AIG2-like uncharacterized protein YtfP